VTYPRVLCLGEVLFDLLSDQPGRSLEAVTSWTAYPGGAPANVASALVKLGTSAGFFGCVGVDQPGQTLVDLLQSIGVETTGIQRHVTAPTREVFVVRTIENDRIFAGFGDRCTSEFADAHLRADLLPTKLFAEAEYLVLGTLELAYPDSRRAIERAIELAEQNHLKLLVDVNWRPVFWSDLDAAKSTIQALLKRVDFLKLTDEEADWLFDTQDPGVVAGHLGQLEGVLITAGEKGCAYLLGDNHGQLPAFAIDVEDTTGAGDSFTAGFLHQLCQHGIQSLADPDLARQVAAYASAAGALTTTRPGAIAAQPTGAEVEAFLYLHQQDG
jgi:fructokinase